MNEVSKESILNNMPLGQISSGFMIGLSVGYFLKKSFKLLLFMLGLATVAIFWFNSKGLLSIDNSSIMSIFDTFLYSLKSSYSFVYEHIKALEPIAGASIVAGFFTGLKFG